MTNNRQIVLKDKERIDDLQINGLKIIQNPDFFCFGMDAVLLSSFVVGKKNDKYLDLGTGNGIIPLLLYGKNQWTDITGIEVQKDCFALAKKNIIFNQLENEIKILEMDIKDCHRLLTPSSYDVITVNPPYISLGNGLVNPKSAQAIARHEILCTLDDILKAATRLLKPGGHFFMIHRPRRLSEIISFMKKNALEPKRFRFVHPNAKSMANMFLVEGVKHGGEMAIVESPLIVYQEDGNFTKEIREIYGGR